jgi:hypothetical protein
MLVRVQGWASSFVHRPFIIVESEFLNRRASPLCTCGGQNFASGENRNGHQSNIL